MAKLLDLTGLTHFWSKVKTYIDGAVSAAKTTVGNYTINGKKISSNPTLSKGDLGLGNVTNDAQVKRSEMGMASGVATLGSDGKIPLSQIAGSVDDIVEFGGIITSSITVQVASPSGAVDEILYSTTKKTFVAKSGSMYYNNWEGNPDANIGEPDSYGNVSADGVTPVYAKIYVIVSSGSVSSPNDGKEYKWSGTQLSEVPKALVLGTSSSNAFPGDKGNVAYNHALAKGVAANKNGDAGLYKVMTNAEGHVTKATEVSKSDITALGIPAQDTKYGIATTSTAGLVKPASVITKPSSINSPQTASGRYYHVQMSSDGSMFVNVPWTDNNTTYESISTTDIDGLFS